MLCQKIDLQESKELKRQCLITWQLHHVSVASVGSQVAYHRSCMNHQHAHLDRHQQKCLCQRGRAGPDHCKCLQTSMSINVTCLCMRAQYSCFQSRMHREVCSTSKKFWMLGEQQVCKTSYTHSQVVFGR